MKKEDKSKNDQNESGSGFPIQAILLLGTLILAIFALALKFMGIF